LALPHIVIDNDMPITVLDSIIGQEEQGVDTTNPNVEVVTIAPNTDVQSSKIINVIPNPMVDRADVAYSIADEAIVTLKLYNLLGVEILVLIGGERREVGIFRQNLAALDLPNGVYVLRLETVSRSRKDISIEKVIVNR
jgi:hypothetical protein